MYRTCALALLMLAMLACGGELFAAERLGGVGTLIAAGKNTQARAQIEDALKAYVAEGDVEHQAIARLFLGIVEMRSGEIAAARTHLESSVAQFRTLDDGLVLWFALWSLGEFERGQGQYERALAAHEQRFKFEHPLASPESL